ncbi:MAG: UDP-2,3-diacylglucosamine diphosphatase LpxI domain-containing protein, partial [Candidatus Puniceispirillales bacterium]
KSIVARQLINKISTVGDNEALNIIEVFFKNNGFKIIPISSVLKNCFFSKGFYGKNFLNPIFLEYIQKSTKFGIHLLNTISKFDVGQSLVVSNNLVYAVEAMEGTDSMLERVKKLTFNNENAFNNPPILIKIPKKGQNKKIDLPVVGFNTVKKCVDARIGSIVVSSKGTIIVDLKKINAFIAKTNFSIFSV